MGRLIPMHALLFKPTANISVMSKHKCFDATFDSGPFLFLRPFFTIIWTPFAFFSLIWSP